MTKSNRLILICVIALAMLLFRTPKVDSEETANDNPPPTVAAVEWGYLMLDESNGKIWNYGLIVNRGINDGAPHFIGTFDPGTDLSQGDYVISSGSDPEWPVEAALVFDRKTKQMWHVKGSTRYLGRIGQLGKSVELQ